MSDHDRLNFLSGIYRQDDGNTFVVTIRESELVLKTNEVNSERLLARGDGLFDVENTNAKIKFHLMANGQANKLTFYLPDRQTVAIKNINTFKESSIKDKFKELGIAILIFLALIGVFFLSYGPMKNSCLKGGGPTICRLASIAARLMGKTEEGITLGQQKSRQMYNSNNKKLEENCNDGDTKSCLLLAKLQAKIDNDDRVDEILKQNCYQKKHGPSCQYWREFYLLKKNGKKANDIMEKACDKDVAISCHEMAYELKKNGDQVRALTFFDKSCGLNFEKSCYELGLYHLKYNRSSSFEYLKKACDSYHRQACDMKEKVEKFFHHKYKCEKENDAKSCFLIASFEQDYGDRKYSLELYEKACKMGNKLACNVHERQKKIQELKNSGEKVETI